jgi:hypothetical protein
METENLRVLPGNATLGISYLASRPAVDYLPQSPFYLSEKGATPVLSSAVTTRRPIAEGKNSRMTSLDQISLS